MKTVVCLSVLWLFAAVDGSPVGEKSPETKVKLSQEQKIVDIPGEHKSTGTQNIEEQESTDTEREGQKSSHSEMMLPGKQNSTELEVTIQGEQGSSKMEMLKEHMSTELEKIPDNSHLHEYGGSLLDGNRTIAEDQESIKPQFKMVPDTTGQGYVFYESAKGSFKLHRTPAAWRDARLTCYDEGAELASPENEALLVAMSKVLVTSSQPPLHVFTGVNDLYSKGFFTSLRGTPLSRMPAHWAPFEPDNINHDDNCLVMQRNGLLLDSKCDDVYPYLCYKKLPSGSEHHCGNMEYVFYKSTNSCYKFHTETTTFRGAYATCVREGGNLAVPNSDSEATFLGQLFPNDWTVALVGFSYWRKDLWVTVHGETLEEAGYKTWANGEPNDWEQQERCGSVYRDGKLNDISCNRLSGYICEKKSDLMWN